MLFDITRITQRLFLSEKNFPIAHPNCQRLLIFVLVTVNTVLLKYCKFKISCSAGVLSSHRTWPELADNFLDAFDWFVPCKCK